MAAKHNFNIEQGATFERTLTLTNSDGSAFNLTGYTAKLQARNWYDSTTPILTLTSDPAAGIVITALTSVIAITIAAATTAALTPANGVFDLEITNGTKTIRLIEGQFIVEPEVTKS